MAQRVLDRLYVPLLIAGMLVTGENHTLYHKGDAQTATSLRSRARANPSISPWLFSFSVGFFSDIIFYRGKKGCANSLFTKYQDNQCVENCDDPNPSHRLLFEQPVFQTFQMFLGEVCLWSIRHSTAPNDLVLSSIAAIDALYVTHSHLPRL